ncbi:hypothetical protein BJ165DRAFT_1497768 [Panaeolus papilionaceus]|nr:hypothetical protein BJ165DRAFT_1497768 [Panaeolus papilionaceus]
MHYSSRLEKVAPLIRIRTPSIDMPHINHELVPYDGFDESQFSLTQWMSAGPLFTEGDIYDSPPCPPSFVAHPHGEDHHLAYDEVFDGNAYTWSYDNHTGYDAGFSSLPEPAGYSNTFSPTISVVSCSPRSEHSGLSLSPQPNASEFATAFNFDFTTSLPHEFPSTSSSPFSSPSLHTTHSPKSSKSHSPSLSCSSLDVDVKLPISKSRDSSPGQSEKEAQQQQRRRFPCLILGCERRFTSQYTLKVHMEAHKPKPRSSFPCTLGCSERFSRQHDRLRHEVAKHGKICEFLCDECGRFFSSKKTLGNHKCPVAQGGTRWVSN